MEDEDLEETNNEDCGQRARRLATLIKEEKTKGGQDRPIQRVYPCILRMIYSLKCKPSAVIFGRGRAKELLHVRTCFT